MNDFIETSYLSDPSICDRLVGWFNDNKDSHHKGGVTAYSDTELSTRSEKISTDFSFDVGDVISGNSWNQGSFILAPYLKELQKALDEYCIIYPFCNHGLPFNIGTANIQFYKPYEGFKVFHYERSSAANFDRHLVFMTYLNSVEDGGGTEFLYQRKTINAVKGKTVIFPADWTHAHRGIVSPTEEKYIITGWYIFKTSNQRIRYDIRKIGE